MKKKLIAVVPLWDDEKNSIWMLPGYMDALRDVGAIPVILPLHSNEEDVLAVFELCDGLLITGGHDVSPDLYGQKTDEHCDVTCEARDAMEIALYKAALKTDKAVLGICRGIQIINVLQGGTLYQDLPAEYESSVEHNMKPPYTEAAHDVDIMENTALAALLGVRRMGVNSCHHQAVKEIGNQLEVMAVSEDGIIEALRHTGQRFVWAVQWHPEFSFYVDSFSRKLFEAFVDGCESK